MGIEALKSLIPAVYGLAMLNGYLMNDMLREYLNSGDFSRRGRMKDALREALMFYGPLLVIGIIILVRRPRAGTPAVTPAVTQPGDDGLASARLISS